MAGLGTSTGMQIMSWKTKRWCACGANRGDAAWCCVVLVTEQAVWPQASHRAQTSKHATQHRSLGDTSGPAHLPAALTGLSQGHSAAGTVDREPGKRAAARRDTTSDRLFLALAFSAKAEGRSWCHTEHQARSRTVTTAHSEATHNSAHSRFHGRTRTMARPAGRSDGWSAIKNLNRSGNKSGDARMPLARPSPQGSFYGEGRQVWQWCRRTAVHACK